MLSVLKNLTVSVVSVCDWHSSVFMVWWTLEAIQISIKMKDFTDWISSLAAIIKYFRWVSPGSYLGDKYWESEFQISQTITFQNISSCPTLTVRKSPKPKKSEKWLKNQWSTLNQKWSSSLINYDVGCPLWPQQPQREEKSDEAPSGAKMRPNGKETKQFGTKKQPNWAPQVIRLYWYLWRLACLGQSVSWNHKIGVLLVKPKVTVKHQVGKTLFENIE